MPLMDGFSILDMLPKIKVKHPCCPSLNINGFSLKSLILSQALRDA